MLIFDFKKPKVFIESILAYKLNNIEIYKQLIHLTEQKLKSYES